MNTNSNTYTIIYTTVLVVVVAAILAIVSSLLKPRQIANVELEQMKSIMLAANIGEVDGQPDKTAKYDELFNSHITSTYVLNEKGEKSDVATENFKESKAFKADLKSQFNAIKNGGELTLPVYEATLDNGEQVKIFPCYGAGLWGAIWGYLAVKADNKTIQGAIFAHASETPGLGGEIASPWFYNQFDTKVLESDGQFASVKIVKGGANGNPNGVDAISGASITSRSLQTAIAQWMDYYKAILTASVESIPAMELIPVEEAAEAQETENNESVNAQ